MTQEVANVINKFFLHHRCFQHVNQSSDPFYTFSGESFKLYFYWQNMCDNASASASDTLATLGSTTKIGLFLFLVSGQMAKASTVAPLKLTVACHCCRQFCQQMSPM
jgi:hypothetical protein